jgi:hypothetical protein
MSRQCWFSKVIVFLAAAWALAVPLAGNAETYRQWQALAPMSHQFSAGDVFAAVDPAQCDYRLRYASAGSLSHHGYINFDTTAGFYEVGQKPEGDRRLTVRLNEQVLNDLWASRTIGAVNGSEADSINELYRLLRGDREELLLQAYVWGSASLGALSLQACPAPSAKRSRPAWACRDLRAQFAPDALILEERCY